MHPEAAVALVVVPTLLAALSGNPAPPSPSDPAAPTSTTGTPVTFQLTGGGLNVTQPVSADLGSASTSSSSLSGPLGEVTVDDRRGALQGSYTVTVESTGFTTGRETPYEIAAERVAYSTPGRVEGTGTAERVAGPGGALDEPRTAVAVTGIVGNGTSTWTPTITVTLPPDAVAGRYTGTITHSVA